MTSQIPGISSTQSTAPVNAVASQQSNVTTLSGSITQIDEQEGAKVMNSSNYDQKTVMSVLQNTYLFSENEARQIFAFATAVRKTELKDLCPNVKPGVLDKIKALCAKILEFFGNNTKTVQLHKDGIAVFNKLKNAFLSPKDREVIFKILEENKENPDVLKGFYRILGNFDFLINPQLLKEYPDVKAFLEQKVLPILKEEVLAGLTENLGQKASKKDSKFQPSNQIFSDLGRNFQGIFHIGNKTIEIGPFESESGYELAFEKLKEEISDLPPELQEKVHEFCKGFPTQGVFALKHPRVNGYGKIDCARPQLEVLFEDKGLVHVKVSSENGKGNQLYWDDTARNTIYPEITTPICKFEFDYHPEDGSSSNIQLTEYLGQTVTIDLEQQ
ncbi:MAG: hypothetical protein ACSW8C_02960 [bacterium]